MHQIPEICALYLKKRCIESLVQRLLSIKEADVLRHHALLLIL